MYFEGNEATVNRYDAQASGASNWSGVWGVGVGPGGGVDWGRVGGRVAVLGEISFGVCGLCSWALVGALDLFVHKCLQLT